MKVLHVIPSLSWADGGPSQAIRLIEQALAVEGIAVETVSTDDDGPGRHMQRALGVIVTEEGSRHRRYFRKSSDFYKTSWSFARWIPSAVHNYDLIHVHALFSFVSIVAAWAALRAGVPLVIRPLGTLNGYGLQHRRPWLKRWSLRWIEGPLVKRASAIHVTSLAECDEVNSLGLQARCVVIPLALPESVPLSCPAIEAFPELCAQRFVLFLSRLDPKKNIEGLLHAWGSIQQDFPDVYLRIAGAGDAAYVARLRALAVDLSLQRIEWLGHVAGEYKTALLQQADAFVLPSYSENFGIAVAEALAAGLPCIVGEGVALASQIAAAGAGVVVSTEPGSIAMAMRQLLTHHAQRNNMASHAGILANDFSVPALGRNLHDLYRSILT